MTTDRNSPHGAMDEPPSAREFVEALSQLSASMVRMHQLSALDPALVAKLPSIKRCVQRGQELDAFSRQLEKATAAARIQPRSGEPGASLTTDRNPPRRPPAAVHARSKEVESFLCGLVRSLSREKFHVVIAYATPLPDAEELHGIVTTLPDAMYREVPAVIIEWLMDLVASHAHDPMPRVVDAQGIDGNIHPHEEN